MLETASLPPQNSHRYVKDPVPVPLPPPRLGGLTRLLKGLAVGESGVIPRRAADDIYRLGVVLNRTFKTRRIDAEKSRVWRVK